MRWSPEHLHAVAPDLGGQHGLSPKRSGDRSLEVGDLHGNAMRNLVIGAYLARCIDNDISAKRR